MPRFSIVLPCFRVQGFLRECLDSVLEQSFGDLEVIAVNDGSPDGGGAILDEYTARDPRVRAVHLPENVGPGRARNAGMSYATGDHLLFLDGDDLLTPGALRVLADRLAETGDPDVLVFDHARLHWWGGTGRGALARIPAEDTFDVNDHPGVLDLPTVAWNKVHRREFLTEHGFRFPPGSHADTAWTFPVLLSARRIAVLDRICLNHRQRRPGALPSTAGPGHFDVHDQYERVFAFVAERPRLAPWMPYLHARMGAHCLEMLSGPDRLPPADRPEFFRRSAEMFRRHKPRDVRLTPELRVLEGPYAAYVAKRQVLRTGRRLGSEAVRVRRAVSSRARRTGTALAPRRTLEAGLVVYSAFSHRGMLGDPGAIHRKAREIAPQLRGVWVVRDERTAALLPPDVEHVLPDSPRYREITARAAFFVSNVDWPGALPERSGSVHIQTHQGTPLKFMGADLLEKPGARYGLDVPRMLRRADRWDHSLVADLYSELVWERAYPCHFASARTGSPRNDVLVAPPPGAGAEFRLRHGIPQDHTVVLYAPTRRDYRRGGHAERIDPARLAADLGEGHTLVVRLHPSLARGPARRLGLSEPARRGLLVDATDEPHVEEVMLASDVLLTDYSALMFDYARLDRPIVLHADDWDTYTASRGTYVDITAEPPGHVSRTYRELARLFTSGAWRDEESALLRAAFRGRYGEFDDGHAAERVVRTLLLGERDWTPAPAGAVPQPRTAAGHGLLATSRGGAPGCRSALTVRGEQVHSMR
ncbi:CDP-glycerol glycerophosphotransferase family protein [Streptomyces sp. NPDC006458]|uniref:bifunctional glycosyltransferase/CDP-glycerol:glycerophosphate glycerophosphotransferase n=1 Tax=Streptomyces sp. NPDC006458 TaxID=3154302 RepID=UPI0033A494A1